MADRIEITVARAATPTVLKKYKTIGWLSITALKFSRERCFGTANGSLNRSALGRKEETSSHKNGTSIKTSTTARNMYITVRPGVFLLFMTAPPFSLKHINQQHNPKTKQYGNQPRYHRYSIPVGSDHFPVNI